MIYKRAIAKLRAQDWFAILVELGIVILGVYIGTWVANRNQQSDQRANTIRLLDELRPEIRYQEENFRRFERYQQTTAAYAKVAMAGWRRDPSVSDNAFVIAAYQASQITGSAINTNSWASMFGNQQVQNIRDPNVRRQLIRVLSLDSTVSDYRQGDTDYRKHVRQTIPDNIQNTIRSRCGDVTNDTLDAATLPATCDVLLAHGEAAATAAALRARSSLVEDLNWHQAAGASLLYTYSGYLRTLQALGRAIDRSGEIGAE